MGFARFMASWPGRILRIVVGLFLAWYGFNVIHGGLGIAVSAFGVIAVLAGTLNLCLLAALLGAPFRGRDVLKAP
ncbi:MAG TPA: hypothetical protein VK454_11705 [Myxococcaceae bacterium]|nr:hypothetical protein [Myxococcaceae bacterium]